MPGLRPKLLEPGDTLSATTLQTYLESVEDISADIGRVNIRDEAVGVAHLSYSSDPVCAFIDSMKYNNAGYSETSTSFVVVGAASTPCSITGINTTIDEGDVVEMYASVLTGDTTLGDATEDYYWLRFYMTHSGATTVALDPVWGFSFRDTNDVGSATADKIEWNRHLCSYKYIHTGSSVTLNTIALRIRLQDTSDSVIIHKWNLVVSILKH